MTTWDTRRTAKAERVHAGSAYCTGKVVDPARLGDLLQDVIRPGDRGVTSAVETPPGHLLTRLLASAVPSIRAYSVADHGFAEAARLTVRERRATPSTPCRGWAGS